VTVCCLGPVHVQRGTFVSVSVTPGSVVSQEVCHTVASKAVHTSNAVLCLQCLAHTQLPIRSKFIMPRCCRGNRLRPPLLLQPRCPDHTKFWSTARLQFH